MKVLCHGLAGSSSLDWYRSLAKAYMAMNYNVIAVDWARYAFSGYVKAISMTQKIGSSIGELIINVTKIFDVPVEDIHIIGHSLGGHIAGFSGKYIYNNLAKKIGRITGLDPAGPLYNYVPNTKRLSTEDALFVDILHTNAGVLGILPSIGHMDFYPDGGIYQNTCEPSESECSHNIVLSYFIRSVGYNIFEAVLCDSYVNFTMGYCKDNYKSFMGDGCQFTVRVLMETQADEVSQDHVKFYLSNNVHSSEQFFTGNYSHLSINTTNDVKIVCHGWLANISITNDAKTQYNIRGGVNIIGVDWSHHALDSYLQTTQKIESVGYYIALLITDISKKLGISLSQFHAISPSLGAHLVAFAGQHVQKISGEKIGRITALDPTSILFQGKDIDQRLSDDDADFVDVIHTDSIVGFRESIGHVDYYPNGGGMQNGCGTSQNGCSHSRAAIYFYESINDNGFVAVACSSKTDFNNGRCDGNEKIIMGENVDRNARGDFYLKTASSSPFALG
ncbi:hypothetical protein Trydic_g11004 [Trypoxylus dichotomus]